MSRVLWGLQMFFGIYFVVIGVMHFILPPGLPAAMAWMYELSPMLHYVSGTAEILGGLGLILPAVTGIQTRLVPLAAAGLATVMVLAVGWHLPRGEMQNIVTDAVLAAILVFIAYGRWRLRPHA